MFFSHKSRSFVAIVLGLSLALPAAAVEKAKAEGKQAPAAAGKIRARILATDGKTPIAGAVLRAYLLETGQVFESRPTTSKGECEIGGLPFGYVDLAIDTPEGTFVANQVVNVPPASTVGLSFVLTKFSDHPAAWWSGREPRAVPGSGKPAAGAAEVRPKAKGREFWTSAKGIAILAGGAGAVLLALASSGGATIVSPSSP